MAGNVVELRDPRSLRAASADPAARRYLAPEPLIESDDPEIRAEAEKAVRGATAPRARAEALTRYVNGLLEKKPTVSIPSAREVLRTKVGDCNEHTALYVAMARALGIPARISVGLVFVRGALLLPRVARGVHRRGKPRPLAAGGSDTQRIPGRCDARASRARRPRQADRDPAARRTAEDDRARSRRCTGYGQTDHGECAHGPRPARRPATPAHIELRVPTMIAIHDLIKTYGRFTAVNGVSLEVKPGEIHGFLGPNGAGKTTTLRMIAGLLKPTAGRIEVNGHDLATEPEAAKASLGFIPDRPFIYEKLTAGEFLRFHGGLFGMDGDGIGERVREMLELFELGQWEHELVESFSHGMKQRLVMSAAFLHRPRAVVVDEPMVGLDPRGARLIKDVFRRMSERGVAILMSTHTLEVARRDVRPDQHHPQRPDHRERHRGGAARDGWQRGARRPRRGWRAWRRSQSTDGGFSQTHGRERASRDR